MQKLKSCLLAILWPALNCFAQSPPTLRPLSVGDTIPDITLTNVYNYPVSKIQLSGLKGKIIILDFWDRTCVSCIQALPIIDSLQQVFKDELQVLTIADHKSSAEVEKTLNRFPITRNLRLPVLFSPNLLRQLFPYKLVSHVVWIGRHGVVRAITGTEYITASNISAILNSDVVDWPVKDDNLAFDPARPLFGILQQGIQPPFIYQSSFTGHMRGIAPANGTHTDSVAGSSTTGFYNKTLLALCRIAIDYRTNSSPEYFILDVKDTARYIMPKNQYHAVWDRDHTFCYAVQLPLAMEPAAIKSFVQSDLLRWLALLGIRLQRVNGKICITDK